MSMTAKQIEATIEGLADGQTAMIEWTHVSKKLGSWWVQAGGGCTFHKTARRAAVQARKLNAHINRIED